MRNRKKTLKYFPVTGNLYYICKANATFYAQMASYDCSYLILDKIRQIISYLNGNKRVIRFFLIISILIR